MKKILFALLCTFPFIFTGCGEETTTTTGGGEITPPPTETNLTVSGVSQYYFIPIADIASEKPRQYIIQFYIHNNTANTYNNVILKPIFTDEDNNLLTEADGLSYTAGFPYDIKDIKTNSLHTAKIHITYTGTQKMNVKFKVEVASDNMPTETFNFNTANFLTYLQAFWYKEDGNSVALIPITADTKVTDNNVKIIFMNLMAPLDINLKGSKIDSGEVILPQSDLVLVNGSKFRPCSNKTSSGNIIEKGTFVIGQGQACYLEIKSNLSDIWTYNPLNKDNIESTPDGYKPTDAINIQVQ